MSWWYSPDKSNLHKFTPSLSKCQNGSHWEEVKSAPHSPLPFTFYFEHPSGWHRFWLLHISPILLVCAFWKQEWHSVIGWWRGAMPGQTGWGLGCHCKQSSAYSWNEITLWQWHCFAFEAACLFLNCKSFGEHLFPGCPSQLFAPANCRSVIAKSKPFLPPHKETGFVINIFTLLWKPWRDKANTDLMIAPICPLNAFIGGARWL